MTVLTVTVPVFTVPHKIFGAPNKRTEAKLGVSGAAMTPLFLSSVDQG